MADIFTSAMANIQAGRDLAKKERRNKIFSQLDLGSTGSLQKGVSDLVKAGDIEGQQALRSILSSYEEQALKNKKVQAEIDKLNRQESSGAAKYGAMTPDQMSQFAGQQREIVKLLGDLSANIDEKGFQALKQQASAWGYGQYIPETYEEFDARRGDIASSANVISGFYESISKGTPAKEATNKMHYDLAFSSGVVKDPYNSNVDYTTIPTSVKTAALADKRYEATQERSKHISESKAAEEAVKAIGLDGTSVQIDMKILVEKLAKRFPDMSPSEITSRVLSRIKKAHGDYPSQEAAQSAISSMLKSVESGDRKSADATSSRLNAVKTKLESAK